MPKPEGLRAKVRVCTSSLLRVCIANRQKDLPMQKGKTGFAFTILQKYPFPFLTIILVRHIGDNFVASIYYLVHKQNLSLERNGSFVKSRNKRIFR